VMTVTARLGHSLEVDARPAAVRIDDRADVIPVFLQDTVLDQPGPPRGGGLGWSLQLVAERIGPEPRSPEDQRSRRRLVLGWPCPPSLVTSGPPRPAHSGSSAGAAGLNQCWRVGEAGR
jgi:hypothetical protein